MRGRARSGGDVVECGASPRVQGSRGDEGWSGAGVAWRRKSGRGGAENLWWFWLYKNTVNARYQCLNCGRDDIGTWSPLVI